MNAAAKTLSDVAPTLVQLKKLPMEQKCRLLLARLARIGKHDGALNKHNLMMPGDPYGLADGYPETEKTAVREHLLGAPWTRLVNEGLLVDLSGQGFYKVSDEGREYLEQEEPPKAFSLAPASVWKSASGAPRAFLSYSWDGPEHQRWVTEFAERLQGESGVEIIFDGWHLNPGDDKLRFMEMAVSESDFVIVVCTEAYAERANNREGGVGYESTIITAVLAERILTNKFVPVLRKGSWTSSLPIYLKSRFGVNLTDKPYREDEYERLLRVLHGEPIQPPPIGSKPDFSRKAASKPHPRSVPGVGAGGSSRSGPSETPNAVAWATYDKPGVDALWVGAYVRPWNVAGKEQFRFETTRGDEYVGTKGEIIERFFSFHRLMLKEGYKRMNFTPGPDPDFSVLGS